MAANFILLLVSCSVCNIDISSGVAFPTDSATAPTNPFGELAMSAPAFAKVKYA